MANVVISILGDDKNEENDNEAIEKDKEKNSFLNCPLPHEIGLQIVGLNEEQKDNLQKNIGLLYEIDESAFDWE